MSCAVLRVILAFAICSIAVYSMRWSGGRRYAYCGDAPPDAKESPEETGLFSLPDWFESVKCLNRNECKRKLVSVCLAM